MKDLEDRYNELMERSARRKALLMAASRYVESYADNENNHPQARDGARSLLADIKAAIT